MKKMASNFIIPTQDNKFQRKRYFCNNNKASTERTPPVLFKCLRGFKDTTLKLL